MKIKPTNRIKICTPPYRILVIDSINVPNFLFSPSLITEKAQYTLHSFLEYSHLWHGKQQTSFNSYTIKHFTIVHKDSPGGRKLLSSVNLAVAQLEWCWDDCAAITLGNVTIYRLNCVPPKFIC